ncbi:MAG: hypothetical protein B7Z15_20015 [Rhizobiales bacterium 32-66-8]|nr:MAG: hypothetical protein B7Z15_20015 [Rhizobiales bacterium 32-66-8]
MRRRRTAGATFQEFTDRIRPPARFAISLIFGTVVSTALAVFVVPILYDLDARRRTRNLGAGGEIRAAGGGTMP